MAQQQAAAQEHVKQRHIAKTQSNAPELSGKANLAVKLQAAKDGGAPPQREREAAHAPAAQSAQPPSGKQSLADALTKAKENVTVPQPSRDLSRGR